MNDYQGKELSVGDYVIFCRPNYRELITGRIFKITPMRLRILYKLDYRDPWFSDHTISSCDVVKMEAQDVNVLILKGRELPISLPVL